MRVKAEVDKGGAQLGAREAGGISWACHWRDLWRVVGGEGGGGGGGGVEGGGGAAGEMVPTVPSRGGALDALDAKRHGAKESEREA